MNKYKMISICSFIIVCVLLVSMLLPIKTIAEDKESLELNMHYEDSKVTAEITVNSDIYTGIVCKYLMVDDVLKSDNILAQTKESGITINMDKNENNIYKTVIPNVTKRYVVIYVSIGNCSLCDYIDCQPNKNQDQNDQPNQDQNDQPNQDQNNQPNQNQNDQQNQNQNDQQNQNQNDQPNQDQNDQPNQDQNNQPNQNQNNQPNQDQNDQPNQDQNNQQNQNKNEQPNQNEQQNQNNQSNQSQNEQPSQNQNEQPSQNQNEQLNQNSQTNNGSGNGNNNNSSNINKNTSNDGNVKVIDKDNIDTSDFQEIEKVVTSTTSDGSMPQTGEDDFVKILGIVVFSLLSIFSFYKYEKTK